MYFAGIYYYYRLQDLEITACYMVGYNTYNIDNLQLWRRTYYLIKKNLLSVKSL